MTMNCSDLRYDLNAALASDIERHLGRCDALFIPPLSLRVHLLTYAQKIREHAVTFEAWAGSDLVGLVAAYFNDRALGEGFITNVSVETAWRHLKVGTKLMERAIEWGRVHDYPTIRLEVQSGNSAAIGYYEAFGFRAIGLRDGIAVLKRTDR